VGLVDVLHFWQALNVAVAKIFLASDSRQERNQSSTPLFRIELSDKLA